MPKSLEKLCTSKASNLAKLLSNALLELAGLVLLLLLPKLSSKLSLKASKSLVSRATVAAPPPLLTAKASKAANLLLFNCSMPRLETVFGLAIKLSLKLSLNALKKESLLSLLFIVVVVVVVVVAVVDAVVDAVACGMKVLDAAVNVVSLALVTPTGLSKAKSSKSAKASKAVGCFVFEAFELCDGAGLTFMWNASNCCKNSLFNGVAVFDLLLFALLGLPAISSVKGGEVLVDRIYLKSSTSHPLS